MSRQHEIVTLGGWTDPGSDAQRLQDRILELVRAGVPRRSFGSDGVLGFHGLWWHEPGTCSWWETRQRVGGRVTADAFRDAVDARTADGRLIEVWLARVGRRQPAHTLLIPGHAAALRRPVTRARGRPDVLAREPWAARLGGGR